MQVKDTRLMPSNKVKMARLATVSHARVSFIVLKKSIIRNLWEPRLGDGTIRKVLVT